MNHLKIYELIVQKANSENRIKLCKRNEQYVYYENHHILPKCLDGNNEKENLVLLTGREHYICHKLLTYIYPKNRKIAQAFHRMTFSKNGNLVKSSKDYAYARKLISLIGLSEETKTKMSAAQIGVSKSPEHINHMKGNKNALGFKHTDTAKEKISSALKLRISDKNPNFGKPAWNRNILTSEETKQKISQSCKGRIPWNKKLNANVHIC